jgi:hypothetical protein
MIGVGYEAREEVTRMRDALSAKEGTDAAFTVEEAFEWVNLQQRLVLDRQRGDWADVNDWTHYEPTLYDPVLNHFRSVAVVVPLHELHADTTVTDPDIDVLHLTHYGHRRSLWRGDYLWDERCLSNARGTAVLVKPNLIMTARHVLKGFDPCTTNPALQFSAIFGFHRSEDRTVSPFVVRSTQVFRIVRVLEKPNARTEDDWVLAELDRDVNTSLHPVVTVRTKDDALKYPVYCLNHGLGLPARFALGWTGERQSDRIFRVGLELFDGASGSPLFDSCTHELVGIALCSHEFLGKLETTIGTNNVNYWVSTLCTDSAPERGILAISTMDFDTPNPSAPSSGPPC